MEKMSSAEIEATAEEIACMADRDEDISGFFTNDGGMKMMPPLIGPHTIVSSPILNESNDSKK
jgi:hypothetical protein